jgi:hypothetical protein
VNFVRSLVEKHNCAFQEIDGANDLGNDAYIEFITDENATGCCIAAQIKAGKSYRTAAGDYLLRSDRDHFEYWLAHTLPVVGIVYDPSEDRALWIDITGWLRAHPERVSTGPFQIFLPTTNCFDEAGFETFKQHFLSYRPLYSSEPAFGTALTAFATQEDPGRALEGLRALFSFHRQRFETWFYLINSLGLSLNIPCSHQWFMFSRTYRGTGTSLGASATSSERMCAQVHASSFTSDLAE